VFIEAVSFNASQVLEDSGASFNGSSLLDSASLEYMTFVETVANITGVKSSGITITSASVSKTTSSSSESVVHGFLRSPFVAPRRKLSSGTRVVYTVYSETQDMQEFGYADAADMYQGIVTALNASTDPSSGTNGAVFDSTLRYTCWKVAMDEKGMNTTAAAAAAQMFEAVTTSPVSTSDGFAVTVVNSAFPTSMPTSMPTCGVGSLRGDSGNCNLCPAGTHRDFGHITSGRACIKCPMDSYSNTEGADACTQCPFPSATFEEGETSCSAFSLNGDTTMIIGVFGAIGLTYFTLTYLAMNDRFATVFFTSAPSIDFV
jgi:hypothetical protein